MNNLEENYISLNEAAKLTNYSQDYISLLCRQKKLKGTKIGRNWVTTREWLESYINKTKGSGQNVIPVKIKNTKDNNNSLSSSMKTDLKSVSNVSQLSKEESEISKHKDQVTNPLPKENHKEDNDPNFITISPFMSKMISTAIILVLFVSSFVFVQAGFQNKSIQANSLQFVKGISFNVQEDIAGLSNSLDTIKNESIKFTSSVILRRDDVAISNSDTQNHNIILNETRHKIASVVSLLHNDIITLSNSLDVIKNESTKFASSVILRRDDEESRNYTIETVSQNDAKLSSESFTPLRSIQNDIIGLSNSLDVIKNESTEFANNKIANLSNHLGTISNHGKHSIISLSNNLDVIKNKSTKFANHKIAFTKNTLGDIKIKFTSSVKKPTPRVAGVSTSIESEQKPSIIDSIKSFFGGVKNYVSGLFNSKTETTIKIVKQDNQSESQSKDNEDLKPKEEILIDNDYTDNSNQKDSQFKTTSKTVYITQTTDTTDLQNRIEKLEQEINNQQPTVIVGSQGPKGDTGEQGEKGDTGSQGLAGTGNITTIPSSPTNTNIWNNGANVFSGYGSFESMGVAYDLSAGRSFGSGGDTTLGSDVQDILTVNASSTFNNPITLSNAATLTTGTGQTTFNGNVDATQGLNVTGANLTVGSNLTLDPTTGDITTTGDISSDDMTVTGNLTVSGAQTYSGAASFTSDSTSSALTVNQQGTGNIVSFQDDGADSFVIADGGAITTGTWNGTVISTQYGGTGQDFSATAQGNIPYFSAAGTISTLSPGTSGYYLKTNGAGADPTWSQVVSVAGPTLVVAASDSLDTNRADYVADGTNDESEIETAIAALPATGGEVHLLEGTFNITTSIDITKSNVKLTGTGNGTKLFLTNGANTTVIVVGDGSNPYEGITISDLQVDGNRSNQTSTSYGINFGGSISKSKINKVYFNSVYTYGFRANNSSDYIISNNIFYSNG
ncbi:hypothetical protein GQ568_00735, partial [Patescibacteria group bacterium]|nr:hypothetical protein [Patescibacteria group bacterium]